MKNPFGVISGRHLSDASDNSGNVYSLINEAAGGPVDVVHLSGCTFSSTGSKQSGASLTCIANSATRMELEQRWGLKPEGFHVG